MNEIEKAAEALVKLVEGVMKFEKEQGDTEPSCRLCTIRFKPSECKKMDENFKKEFSKWGNYCARLRMYDFGYQIRYCRNGYKRIAFHKDLAEAKNIFASM